MLGAKHSVESVSLTRRYHFAAAHRLHTDSLPEDENWRLYGKCNNPHGHGHNYILYITVNGPVDRESGRILRIDALDQVVYDTVVTRFDHRDLNQDPEFVNRVTTGENLVRFIWDLLVKRIPAAKLEKIGLVETRDNYFEYKG